MTEVLDVAGNQEGAAVLATINGPVRGYGDDGLQIFKGLRYGAPPTGALRFRPPRQPWRPPVREIPAPPAIPRWPAYNAIERATMMFDVESRVENDPMARVRQILQG